MPPPLITELITPKGVTIYHRGPALFLGPLPSIFYFTLTGQDSLATDPYNQPITAVGNELVRAFSLTLPGHCGGEPPSAGMDFWAHQIAQGNDPITPFLQECSDALDFLLSEQLIKPGYIAAAGLSRGAFIAAHWAAADPRIQAVLGFAPLVNLDHLEEFHHNPPALALALSLQEKIPLLVGRPLCFFIGNHDTRVSTDSCFSFVTQLAKISYKEGLRSPPVEMHILPPIGHKGHGTSPAAFLLGTEWLLRQLRIK